MAFRGAAGNLLLVILTPLPCTLLMPRPSFSTQLYALWILVAILCGLLTAALWFMLSSALGERVDAAKQQGTAACSAVASRYDLSMQRPGEADVDLMHAVLDLVLIRTEGIEGGFWSSAPAANGTNGFLAYAFPTYEGSGVKRDIPEAETPLILRTLRNVASTGQTRADVVSTSADAVIAVACPIPHHAGLFAWMLTRAHPPLGPYGQRAATLLAGVLAIIVVLALLLAMAFRRWKHNLMQIEQALAPDGKLEQGRRIERLGERDLDDIVDALNRYVERADRLQREANDLRAKLGQAERFGTLGKMAAQIAHEIRNPVGAMRLKAENAIAGDVENRHRAGGACGIAAHEPACAYAAGDCPREGSRSACMARRCRPYARAERGKPAHIADGASGFPCNATGFRFRTTGPRAG